MKLRDLAHSRTGDKGSTVNISVIAFVEADYPALERLVTPERVKAHLAGLGVLDVVRYELPSLGALNFVATRRPQDSVTRSLGLDAHGKTLSSALLEMELDEVQTAKQAELAFIGRVDSPLRSPAEAPRQPDEGAPAAWLVFEPTMRDALSALQVGDSLVLVTWLDRARRDVLQVHPRGDPSRPLTGVFSTRSAERPNPIGLHDVMVTAIDGLRVQVDHLEALDGTPILDVKPTLSPSFRDR